MANTELLRMVGISKYFPGVKALENVSLTVQAGEVHALLGENGAGKSTLIKILNGVYLPDAGDIYIRGQKADIQNINDAQNLKIGIIFQELNLCPDLSVADNVFIGRQKHNRFHIVDKRSVERETQKILDKMGVSDAIRPTDIVREMSVSQMQMVEIAKALSYASDIIVFDEPTAPLSDSEIDTLFDIIKELRNSGKGIIYISHRMEELSRVADTVTILRDGQKIGESFRFREKSLDEVITMMVGRELKDKYPVHDRKIGDVIFEASGIKNRKVDVERLYVRSGEIVGIAGLAGSGRSELARAIFGADPVDSKTLTLHGETISVHSPSEAVKHGLGYLTEDRKREGLALRMDVEKNINMASWDVFRHSIFVDSPRAMQNAKSQKEKLAIKTPSLSQRVLLLSGGNQQKIVLAKWLSLVMRILIFDEPTKGIDVGAKFEIYRLMNMLSDQGVGILMISSELPEILGMSDRIYTMHNGKLNGELQKGEATQEKIMRHIAGVTQG